MAEGKIVQGQGKSHQTAAPAAAPAGAPVDRRSGRDRRVADKGAPSGRDRRVGVEPRKPEVREIELTPSEWGELDAAAPPPGSVRG